MLAPARVKVEGGRIRYIPARIVGDNGNIITYLALVRIAFERIKRGTHRDVGRPGYSGVGAVRIE